MGYVPAMDWSARGGVGLEGGFLLCALSALSFVSYRLFRRCRVTPPPPTSCAAERCGGTARDGIPLLVQTRQRGGHAPAGPGGVDVAVRAKRESKRYRQMGSRRRAHVELGGAGVERACTDIADEATSEV
uniref:Uncharacterized protein n=1 Tax=Haptolina ericina TaxID=156174 RepID=A0A7S3B219_9EUKA